MDCPIVNEELEKLGLTKEIFMKAIKMTNKKDKLIDDLIANVLIEALKKPFPSSYFDYDGYEIELKQTKDLDFKYRAKLNLLIDSLQGN